MDALFALSITPVSVETILSVVSASFTAYFWLVKARREKPSLAFFQLRNFRATLRKSQNGDGKRLCLTQVESGGVLIANNSTRQNAILRFDCFLKHEGKWLPGSWGYVDNDVPPWNIPPESAIALSLACFFDVADGFEIPEDVQMKLDFITVGKKRFRHNFTMKAPVA